MYGGWTEIGRKWWTERSRTVVEIGGCKKNTNVGSANWGSSCCYCRYELGSSQRQHEGIGQGGGGYEALGMDGLELLEKNVCRWYEHWEMHQA